MYHGDARGYNWAHQRVRATRGVARQHVCPCGKPADEWAYGHNDPNPRTDTITTVRGKTTVVTWSDDPAHYIAMCRRCHARLDFERGNRANIATGVRELNDARRACRYETFYNVATALMAAPDVRHYGYALAQADGVKYGSLTSTLGRMRADGWLTTEWEDVAVARAEGRPPRRYYTVTEAGRAAMTELLQEA